MYAEIAIMMRSWSVDTVGIPRFSFERVRVYAAT